jgi:hypothetical protein
MPIGVRRSEFDEVRVSYPVEIASSDFPIYRSRRSYRDTWHRIPEGQDLEFGVLVQRNLNDEIAILQFLKDEGGEIVGTGGTVLANRYIGTRGLKFQGVESQNQRCDIPKGKSPTGRENVDL